MSSGAGPSQGQSACSFPTAYVRIIPSPLDPSPFNRGRKKVHVLLSFNIYWRKATDDVKKQPRSLLDFGNAYSLQIERVESNASREDVERIVKAVTLPDGKPSLIVPGFLHVPSHRGLVKKKVKIELTPECLQQRDAWLEHIRTCVMPWNLIRQEMKKLHSIMQQNASVEELRKRIQGVVIGGKSSDLIHDVAVPDNPATSRPFSSPLGSSNEAVSKMLSGIPEELQKLDWADKLNVHVNAAIGIEKVTQVAETAEFVADVSKSVARVSTVFQLLALSARMLGRLAEANRGILILPGFLDRALFLLNRQLQSFGIILDVSANVEKFHEDFAFQVLQGTIDVMVLIETQLLRGSGRRFLKAKVVKGIETKIKELTKDVIITSLISGSNGQSSEPVHEMHHCRPKLSRYFVGRRKELNELKLILRKHGSAAIAQYGGVGKTELMIALAQRAELEDEVAGGVFWLTVDGGLNNVVESLACFVEKLRGVKMTEEDRKDRSLVVAQLEESLSRRKGRWLLCLDNFDNEELCPVLGAVCAIATSSKEKGWVVVTSRLGLPRLWPGMMKEQKINLQPLSVEDAMILLWRQVHGRDAEEEDDKTVRGKLSKLEEENSSEYDALGVLCGDDNPYSLGGLPLALVQAGMYIGRFECSFGDYVNLLMQKNGKAELNEIFRKVGEQYLVKDEKRSFLTTWKLNVDCLSGKANDVLRSMSMLGPFPIPGPVVIEIVKRSADEGESSKRMMRDVIMEELVHGSSLVYRQKKDGRDTFNIHRLVQRFVLADMERGSELWNKSYGNAFLSLRSRIEVMLSIDGNSLDCLPAVFGDQYCLYLPHLFAIIDNYVLPHSGANRVIPASELYDLARFTNELSEFLGDQNAMNMWQIVLEALQCNHGTNRASTLIKSELANSKYFLGCALEKQGELSAAESRYDESLMMLREIHGQDANHPNIAALWSSIGSLYRNQGKLDAAESVYDKSLRMLREIHGQDASHPNIAALLNSLGCLYEEQGKWDAAESRYDESLRMLREIHGMDVIHPNITEVLDNVRSLYEKKEEVESMDGEIPEKRRDIWGNEYSLGLPLSIESCTEASFGLQSIESEPFIGDRPVIKAMDSSSKMKEDPILTRPPIRIADIDQDSKESSSLSLPYIELGNTQVVDRKQLYVQSNKDVHGFQDLFLRIPKALLARNISLLDETLPYDDAFMKTEEMVMSKYMEHHERQVNGWRLASESEAFRRILELARPDLSIQRLHETLLIESEYGFIFLCNDFYFSHDVQNKRMLTMVPGSPAIVLPTRTRFCMSDLIWNVASYQVFLLARRICQFTKAKWRFDCLAQLEKKREGAKQLNVFETNLLHNVTIDLDPTRFSYLVGYQVGCLDVTHDDYFHVGVDMFGDIIVLRLDEASEFDIALPEVYKGMEKIYSHPSFTDMFDVFIGGDHEVPAGMDAVQRLGDGIHNKTYLKRCGGKVVYNLGFVPRNKEFNELWKTPYKKIDLPGKLLSALKKRLDYGEQLSYGIAQHAVFMWKGRRKKITLAEAQHQLFDFWRNAKFENCKRFSLLRAKIHQGWYLMFEAGKLHVVKSDRAITTGINGSISARFPGVSATCGASASVAAREFAQNSPVVNLLDAVVKVSGINPKFDAASKSWYKPTKHGMEQILGGLAIVCALLDGHVDSRGMFYGAVGKEELERPKTKQEVDFNIPISLGLAYSTLSRTTVPDVVPPSNPYFSKKMVFRCAESAVFLVDGLNYELPLILGGNDRDEELITALKDSVGYGDNSVTEQERGSGDEGETLSDNPENNNGPSAHRILGRIVGPRGGRRLEEVMVNSDRAL